MFLAQVAVYNKESISEAQYFIFYMVSITNNCNACVEFVHDLRVWYILLLLHFVWSVTL